MATKVTDFFGTDGRKAELEALGTRLNYALASKDLYEYVKLTNRGYLPNRFGQSICGETQKFLLDEDFKGAFQILIIVASPQHGKSTNITGSAPAWLMGQRSEANIMLLSYGDDLALKFGSMNLQKTREWGNKLFGITLNDTRAVPCTNVNFSLLNQNGGIKSFGLTSGVTGSPAKYIFVDDPVKGIAEADSELQRNSVWNGWQANVKSRLAAKAKIVVILCLTGDTMVLMSDGTEKELKNICIGDSVATYKNGELAVSTVKNWKCQGSDLVFTIRMESGIIIKGNERHPFLVERDGYTTWIRIKNLKVGDKVLRARATGENGAESYVKQKTAINLQDVWDIANPITTSTNGHQDIDAHRLIQNLDGRHDFNTDMELAVKNTNPLLPRKAEDVPYVENSQARTCERIGEENYASTTITPQEKFEDSCVTTATFPSDMAKQKESCFLPLSTFEITLDRVLDIVESGYEDVYDIQVESTENFIANGLVSHNTRWHEDDLAGRIEAYENVYENVKVIRYPCICEDEATDPLHRKVGDSLSPELGKDKEWADHMFKSYMNDPSMGGRRTWDSLYQGRPNALAGNIIEVAWLKFWKPKGMSLPPVKLFSSNGEVVEFQAEEVPEYWDKEIQSWDFTFKDKKTSDFVCGGYLGRRKSCIYLLDAFHEVASFIKSIEAIKEMSRKHPKAIGKYVEDKANGTAIINSLRKELTGLIPIQANDDKVARLRAVTPVIQGGNLYLPHPMIAPWVKGLVAELLSFPNGKNDDWVDMISQALNQLMYQSTDTLKTDIPAGTWPFYELVSRGFKDTEIRKAYMNGTIKLYGLPDKYKAWGEAR